MPMLEWNDGLSVGIEEIDEQHKTLVVMVNDLHDSMKGGAAEAVLMDTVAGMRRYTVDHFGTEERYMEQYAYPELAAHKSEHQDFIAKVVQVEADCLAGKCAMSMDILNFLGNWLVTHIHGTDMKMGRSLVDNGAR